MTEPTSVDDARELIARHVASIRKLRLYVAEQDPTYRRISPGVGRVWPYVTTALSNAEIARQVHLSEDTVKSHLQIIYRHLGVHSRAGAVLAILGEGATP